MPPVSGLRYSQRGSSLEVTLENGQTVNISLTEKTEKITAAAANLSATRLLTGSDSGAIRLWNLQTGEEIVRYISFGIARNDAEDEPSECETEACETDTEEDESINESETTSDSEDDDQI